MTQRQRTLATFVLASAGLCVSSQSSFAEKRVDVQRELQLIEQGRATQHIPDARHRVAIFTYEDPDKTGLGAPLAALVGRTILTTSQVTSLGVLRYEGDLAPASPGAPGYFEKVDRIVSAQRVSIAVWGSVRRSMGRLLIDTYLQMPPEALDAHFTWKLALPARMGSEALRVRLNPSRIAVQRLTLASAADRDLRTVAAALDELRSDPDDGAPVRTRLPQGQTYSLEEVRNQWVRLRLDGAQAGWSRVPSCPSSCEAVMRAAAFAGAMLRYMADRTLPDASGDLTIDAQAAADQVRALSVMGQPAGFRAAQNVAERWTGAAASAAPALAAKRTSAAGSSTFANIHALNRTASLLMSAYAGQVSRSVSGGSPPGIDREVWSRVEPARAAVGEIARRLAREAVRHPGDADLLHNLALLFDYAGDTTRASAARELAGAATR